MTIEAWQFDGSELSTIKIESHSTPECPIDIVPYTERFLRVHTLEGPLVATAGDWIIRGVQGELFPCRADIFAATYTPVE